MPSDPDTKTLSGCITATDETYSGWVVSSQAGLTFLEAALIVTNCTFDSCTGPYALTLSRSSVQVTKTVVNNVASFLLIKQPVNNSVITETEFSGSVVSSLWAMNGKFTLMDCSFRGLSVTAKSTLITATECNEFRIENCTFDLDKDGSWPKVPILYGIASTNIVVTGSQFKTESTARINLSRSYMIVSGCCFYTDLDSLLDLSDGSKVAYENRGNAFNSSVCPYVAVTATVSAQERAFAITTIVVFFVFFAVLFVVLIVYVFCKAGGDKGQQYAGLHSISEEGSEDADIPSD